MNRYFFRIISAVAILLCSFAASAQTPTPIQGKQASKVIESVTKPYSNWSKVELNGKVKSSLLPISASVKISMVKNKYLAISVRVPLMGEAARIQADNDSVTIINKLKKTYCVIPMSALNDIYPDPLPDLQNLLLARVVVMGQGVLSSRNKKFVDIFPSENGNFILFPNEKAQPERASYGYEVDTDGRLAIMAASINDSEKMATMEYTYDNKGGYDISLMMVGGKKPLDAILSLNAPKWGSDPLEPLVPDAKMRRTNLKGVLSF